MNKKVFNKGFTLIELLVVIAIIGILSSIVLASLSSARTKGDDVSVRAIMNNVKTQSELYYANNNSTYGIDSISCDAGMFDATTSGGLNALIEALKAKVGSANMACIASSSKGWVVSATLKAEGSFCVDSKGNSKASTTGIYSSAHNTLTLICN